MSDQNQSLGESRVRTTFNPSQKDTVSQIKQQAAALIDLVNSIPTTHIPNEAGRLKALAMTAIEEGAMWGVKAATI